MISIIILNWNTSGMLLRLFETIKQNTIEKYEVIVLDNGSRQDEYEKIKHLQETVKLIREESNLGFSTGNNKASNFVDKNSDYVFYINSDIIINEHGWDQKHINLLKNDDVGIVGCAYHPLTWDKNGNFHRQPIPNEPVESQSVQGAFFGIKGKIFRDLMTTDDCIFDEAFKYAHYEETDLCFRVRRLGYKVYWVPCKHIHDHNNSATKRNGYNLNNEIKNINDFKANSEKNKQLFVKKHIDFL